MKSPSPALLVVLLATGLVGALLHFRKTARPSPVAEAHASAAATVPSNNRGMDAGQLPSAEARESTLTDGGSSPSKASDPQTSGPRQSAVDMASNYAAAMQTGVFAEEPMPKFAELYLFPTEAARQAAAASHNEFFGSPVDQWSAHMEEQLRSAFGKHPLMANVHTSIMCRAAQCRLQFVERTVRVQPEGELGPNSIMMMVKVANEPWFRENFSEWRTQAATPVAAQVAYQLVVLPRRDPQP